MNQMMDGFDTNTKTSISSNKKQSPMEAIKMIEATEIPLTKLKVNQDEKESQRVRSPFSCNKDHMNKLSKEISSKSPSSSLLGHDLKNPFKDITRTEDKEEDNEELESNDNQMKIKINSSIHINEKTQKHMPTKLEAKVVVRSIGFTETTLHYSKKQKRLVNQVRRNNNFHTTSYANMKTRINAFENDVKTIDPEDPDFYDKLMNLMDKLTQVFNRLVNHGNIRVDNVNKITDKLEDNIMLVHQSATELNDFLNNSRRHLKGYLKVFENVIIENAPKVGIEVRTFNKDILPTKYTKRKFNERFVVFLMFYGIYIQPFSIGKNVHCFFCSECKCIIFSTFDSCRRTNSPQGQGHLSRFLDGLLY